MRSKAALKALAGLSLVVACSSPENRPAPRAAPPPPPPPAAPPPPPPPPPPAEPLPSIKIKGSTKETAVPPPAEPPITIKGSASDKPARETASSARQKERAAQIEKRAQKEAVAKEGRGGEGSEKPSPEKPFTYTAPDRAFQVDFPEPTSIERGTPGLVRYQASGSSPEGPLSFVVATLDLERPVPPERLLAVLEHALRFQGGIGAVPVAAARKGDHDGVHALEERAVAKAEAFAFLEGHRIFVLSVAGKSDEARLRFFDSFKVLDDVPWTKAPPEPAPSNLRLPFHPIAAPAPGDWAAYESTTTYLYSSGTKAGEPAKRTEVHRIVAVESVRGVQELELALAIETKKDEAMAPSDGGRLPFSPSSNPDLAFVFLEPFNEPPPVPGKGPFAIRDASVQAKGTTFEGRSLTFEYQVPWSGSQSGAATAILWFSPKVKGRGVVRIQVQEVTGRTTRRTVDVELLGYGSQGTVDWGRAPW